MLSLALDLSGIVMPGGRILVRAKTKSILDMAGIIKPPEGNHVPIEDMDVWR